MSKGFVKINRELISYEKWETLSFAEKGILHELILRAGWREGDLGKVHLSVNGLSKSSVTARNTITSLLLKLQSKGFISVTFTKETATAIQINQIELQKISGDLAQNLNKACFKNEQGMLAQNLNNGCSKFKQDLAQNLNKACFKNEQGNASYHINIEEEKNIKNEDIPPMSYPPCGEEDEEFFASMTVGEYIPMDMADMALEPMPKPSVPEQGALPGVEIPRKQSKPKKEKVLSQWEQDFEDWWKVFLSLSKGIEGKGGKAVGKTEARKAWENLRKSGNLLSLQDMIEGVKHYANLNDWSHNAQKYIPHAATFLNQRRWEDEVARNFNSNAAVSDPTLATSIDNSPYPSWDEVSAEMERKGTYGISSLSQETMRLLLRMGGWRNLCQLSVRDRAFKRKDYEALVRESISGGVV